MASNPSFEQLLGITFEEDSEYFKFAESEFSRIDFTEKKQNNNALVAGIHEVIHRSYYGRWLDEEGNSIGDNLGGVLYDYGRIYDEIKIVHQGKRPDENSLIYSYLWYFHTPFDPKIYPTNISTPLVTIDSSKILISKEALAYPVNPLAFLKSFLSYCSQSNLEGITVTNNNLVEIVIFQGSHNLDLDDIY